MRNRRACFRQVLLASSVLGLSLAQTAYAQDETEASDSAKASEIVVVGSQIKGAKVNEALPVTVVDRAQIDAVGAVSGDELFRSIPQMGDVSFNSTNGGTSSNFARGDVGSVNLRNLGVGNTLVLLNGRRVVQHPGSQADGNLVPVITYNSNAIPVAGLERLEVLRDGAAAIYGTDAVAGVVNTVLRNDIEGGHVEVQYGGAEGTGLRELQVSGLAGHNFAENRGNFTLSFSYTDRSALDSTDQDFTASADKRPLFEGTRFEGATSLDRRSTLSPWGDFQTPASFGTVRANGTALTNASGQFHIQPSTNSGCQIGLGNGICVDDGNRATGAADRNLRSDGQANYPLSVIPSLKRINLFTTAHYDLTDDLTLFGEAGYYLAQTESVQDSVFSIGSIKMTIPASNYWNPFGAATLPDGTANPNRIAGLNIPAAGLPVTISNYRFGDLGPTRVKVENQQTRFLLGLRGTFGKFNWETAGLYSEATVVDRQTGVSATALQANLALSTLDAYNPFNGGNLANPSGVDTTLSNQAALDAISVVAKRRGKTTLALGDLKISTPDLVTLPGGDVGFAAGVELRRDTQLDDRDSRADGTITWTDTVTGTVQPSDLFGVSPTPDTFGARTVGSAYAELAIPLVSPEMNVPLVRKLEVQVAGRYEHYSDFGSIAKPKVAAAWDVVDGIRLRGSWAQGFRAPNLEQMNASLVTRGNTRTDYVRCEADLQAGRIASFANCSQSYVATAQRSGNPDLKPETSTNWSLGAVLEPRFIPSRFGDFTFTVDYWQIKQKGIVGLFGEGNALILDYLLRQQGSSNPNVVRLAPTADDAALVAGTDLAPVGVVQYVKDQYVNLQPQTVRGLDMTFAWQLRDTSVGSFALNVNAARLLKYYRAPSPDIAALLEARDAGQINAGTAITGGGDLIRQDGLPKWRLSGSLTWSLGGLTVGAFTQYISSVEDTGLTDADGNNWIVKGQVTANLYLQYAFRDGALEGTSFRIGARNVTNEKPPLDSGSYGYNGALYQPYGRYWYASVRKSF
ncbi:TonB-dependent receptor domain-containing protein [Novosphingobium sp. ZW T3_23]|uniref:TonB-dependent receptor domain-containing protein n=1 Tax=Novosphingobium sp. ZW T3_23 TaxID=3378084 RepID=UPI003854791C